MTPEQMRELLTKMVASWRKAADQYARQVEDARARGTPHDQMLSGMTFLRQCAKELEGVVNETKKIKIACLDCGRETMVEGGLDLDYFPPPMLDRLVVFCSRCPACELKFKGGPVTINEQ